MPTAPAAVVTGAGSGIGKAIAHRLAEAGAEVVVVDLDGASAEAVARSVGGRAVCCDITDEAAVAALADTVDELDILVNNAGIWRSRTLQDSTPAEVDAVLRVNVLGSWLVTRALANKFRPAGGAIVNLTSVLAELGGAGRGIYPATPSKLSPAAIRRPRHGFRDSSWRPARRPACARRKGR